MIPLNNVLNQIHSWNNPEANCFKREVGSRFAAVAVVPTEITAIAQNVLIGAFQIPCAIVKTAAKAVAYISGSEAVKNFADEVPGFTSLLRTAVRIISYVAGTALSATVGVIWPEKNFEWHCKLGLAVDIEKLEAKLAARAKVEEELNAQAQNQTANAENKNIEEEVNDVAATIEKNLEDVEAKATVIAQEAAKDLAEAAATLKAEVIHAAEKTVELAEEIKADAEAVPAALEAAAKEAAKEIETKAENNTAAKDADIEETEEDSEWETDEVITSTSPNPCSKSLDALKGFGNGTVYAITHPVESAKTAGNGVYKVGQTIAYPILHPIVSTQTARNGLLNGLRGTWHVITHPRESVNNAWNYCFPPKVTA